MRVSLWFVYVGSVEDINRMLATVDRTIEQLMVAHVHGTNPDDLETMNKQLQAQEAERSALQQRLAILVSRLQL